MNKQISVIIPAYNAEKYIEKCLDSIATQSFDNFEIIVSNDGSTDNTLQIVENFKRQNPQIDLTVISDANSGVSAARKKGLEITKGKWIAFVDADDCLPENALSDLFKLADEASDLIVGFLNPPKNKKHLQQLKNKKEWCEAMLQGLIPPALWGKLYRRNILIPDMFDLPREITNGEDALINIAYAFAMTKPPKFAFSRVYNYTRNPISLSHSTKRTVNYEYMYDVWRMKVIPNQYHNDYLNWVTKYRLNGVMGCMAGDSLVVAQKTHPFFKIITEGIKESGYKLSLFEWLTLNVKSAKVIRVVALVRLISISLRYRLSTLIKV